MTDYVYTVSFNYDAWDHYRIGIASDLKTARRVAQSEWDARDMADDDFGPKLKWQRYGKVWRAYTGRASNYVITKDPVQTTREVP